MQCATRRAPAPYPKAMCKPPPAQIAEEPKAALVEPKAELVEAAGEALGRAKLEAAASSPEAAGVVLERGVITRMPTAHGNFDAVCYMEPASGLEHVALLKGPLAEGVDADRARIPRPPHDASAPRGAPPDDSTAAAERARLPPLVRVHSECATGDIFGSRRCDCGDQLQRALRTIHDCEAGVLIYLRGHEGRGIGLGAKLRAYALQDRGRDTVDANSDQGLPVEARSYAAAALVLRDLGVGPIRLLTNNPEKCDQLRALGVDVAERVPLVTTPNEENYKYLLTKQERMGHVLNL